MQIQVPYGKTTLSATIPDTLQMDVIEPAAVPASADPLNAVWKALETPVDNFDLSKLAGDRSAAIAINDKTRPVPHSYLLPPLLQKLEELGVAREAITFIAAVGLHAPMKPDEFSAILPPEILERYRVISHDAKDTGQLVYRGETQRGTPVWVNRHFFEADLRIVVGVIEPHQFEGFSGGMKSAAIGLAGAETIQHNHALMSEPGARLGVYETNPARQDVEEIGRKMGVQLALNAVLNQKKELVHALAGDPLEVMKAGIPLARQACQLEVDGLYDLLIASPGGYPKDLNLYQAQKGLAHAVRVIRPGGTIILTAACMEGAGSQSFENWMQGMTSFEQVRERFQREGFKIGPHKAYLIARDASKVNLLFVSEMDPRQVRGLLLTPVAGLQEAVDQALARMPQGGRAGILPHAASTIPYWKGEHR